MKEYHTIIIGTGSAMNLADPILSRNPHAKIAVIDKDDPGGICLTRGCIPTKLLLYPAELVRTIERANEFGINAPLKGVDFSFVMKRMRHHIDSDIDSIRRGLSHSKSIDYYNSTAEFIKPYTLKVDGEDITARQIFLCTGSEASIPPIKGIRQVGFHTSDTVLNLKQPPKTLAIVGGGFIAAEYGHFFSSMGTKVTIVGSNPQFLPAEEPEVSALAKKEMSKNMTILTGHRVVESKRAMSGKREIIAEEKKTGKKIAVTADMILLAAGRVSNSSLLHPERAGVEVDEKGWIKVDEHMQTSQPGIWAFGDATGKYLFKHVANYESQVVFYNAILKREMKADYHAVPYAIFTHPEIASVGLKEREAIQLLGEEGILIGHYKYENTAKGSAMNVKDAFVKVIVNAESHAILGASIIGPDASILIQEIINVMNSPNRSINTVYSSMHIHPALPEVVDRACGNLMSLEQYRYMLNHAGHRHH